MENASKALLIAGAILIAILIIAIGMLVYNNAKGSIDSGISQMSSTEIQTHNQQFSQYEGKQRGTSVKALLNLVLANNATHANDNNRKITHVNFAVGDKVELGTNNGDGERISQILSEKILNNVDYTVYFVTNKAGLINGLRITQ